jgi:hypothetical protein
MVAWGAMPGSIMLRCEPAGRLLPPPPSTHHPIPVHTHSIASWVTGQKASSREKVNNAQQDVLYCSKRTNCPIYMNHDSGEGKFNYYGYKNDFRALV